MYHIVIFESTNEVEVVPQNWVRDNICMWPPYKNKDRVKAIKTMVKPRPSWTPYKIRIILTRETYEEARQKLPEAENNTDLTDMDSPSLSGKKRRIKRARFFDEDEDEDEDETEAISSLPAAPDIHISPIMESTCIERTCARPLVKEAEPLPSIGTERTYSPLARENAETLNSTSTGRMNSQPLARREAANSSHTHFSEAIVKKILVNQEIIKEQMGTLVKMVYDLKKLSTTEDSPTMNTDSFPISSLQQLQMIEGQLQQEDFKMALVNTLALRGGTTIKDSVWRTMEFLFTNDMARQTNWRGINGKAAFKFTSLRTVINAAVRRNRLTATATDQEVENWVKRWLQLANDRDGGRRAREKI